MCNNGKKLLLPIIFFVVNSFVSIFFFSCLTPSKTNADNTEINLITIVSHKGYEIGVERFPVWLEIWLSEGKEGLSTLPDYQGFDCFVETFDSESKHDIQNMIDTFSLPQGALKINDWWMCLENTSNKNYYYAYVFYIIPKV